MPDPSHVGRFAGRAAPGAKPHFVEQVYSPLNRQGFDWLYMYLYVVQIVYFTKEPINLTEAEFYFEGFLFDFKYEVTRHCAAYSCFPMPAELHFRGAFSGNIAQDGRARQSSLAGSYTHTHSTRTHNTYPHTYTCFVRPLRTALARAILLVLLTRFMILLLLSIIDISKMYPIFFFKIIIIIIDNNRSCVCIGYFRK
jgi:hypothetical protein